MNTDLYDNAFIELAQVQRKLNLISERLNRKDISDAGLMDCSHALTSINTLLQSVIDDAL